MKIPFYILGLLERYGPQHGYRLKQIMEEDISDFTHIKLPTVYYHLEKLCGEGSVSAVPGKDGNRPEKMVYAVTEKGKERFAALFQKLLTEPFDPELPLDGNLFFGNGVSAEAVLSVLRSREAELSTRIKALAAHRDAALRNIPESGRTGAKLIFDHHLLHLNAELEWLREAIRDYAT
jgi:DNA-binding PadR family transcriptional regulator